ncbi:MAG TPA: helix-turn-helix domain-containing protein [Gemmataceae bacterium]|jgi:excisionase family DNA binding protein|nr:helix-turn-helix domain-containing protein [Gemmataceae bacterium]
MFDQPNELVTLRLRPTSRNARNADRPTNEAQPHEGAGLTVAELAARLRIGEDKVRRFINAGELRAVNTAASMSARPRWVIPPEAVAAFEAKRAGGPGPKPTPRRRRRTTEIDYFPD